jgi:CBS domain-containing protein
MSTAYKIIELKGNAVHTISPDLTVYDALKEMVKENVGALIVMDGNTFKGIFTERDYARKVMLEGRTSRDTLVKDILDADCAVINLDTPIEECMQLMTSKYVRHLPVFDNGNLAGIISIGDLVKYIMEHQKFIINQLESYIAGSR